MKRLLYDPNRRTFWVVSGIIAIGMFLFAVLIAALYTASVDCGGGNVVTWLFRNRSVDAAEVRDMARALASSPHLQDLRVTRVSGRQVVLLVRNGASQQDYTEFTGFYPPGDPRDLWQLWQSVYVKNHPGVSSSIPTNLYVAYADKPSAAGIPMEPAVCASL